MPRGGARRAKPQVAGCSERRAVGREPGGRPRGARRATGDEVPYAAEPSDGGCDGDGAPGPGTGTGTGPAPGSGARPQVTG
ncbi:hypothetical protein GCM10017688_03740 [Streptomyces ramulosus]